MPVAARTRRQRAELAQYAYTWCRTFGHAWEEWHTEHEPEFGYYEAVNCPRCTTERLFTIDMLGNVAGRRYVYPEGYKLSFKVNRSDLRREMRKQGWWSESARSESARAASASASRRARVQAGTAASKRRALKAVQ